MNYSISILLLLVSCTPTTESSIEFPFLKLLPFEKKKMEMLESSFINDLTNNISVTLRWESISGEYEKIRVYKQNSEKEFELISEFKNENTISTILNQNLTFDEVNVFALSVINRDGVESPLSNSNTSRVVFTDARPAKADSFNIIWDSSSIDRSDVINVSFPRYQIFDSLSINIMFKAKFSSDSFKKIISIFGSIRDLGVYQDFPVSEQGVKAVYEFHKDSIKKRIVFPEKIKILNDYDSSYFPDNNLANIFNAQGEYKFYFYFYKSVAGIEYIYKTDFLDTFHIE